MEPITPAVFWNYRDKFPHNNSTTQLAAYTSIHCVARVSEIIPKRPNDFDRNKHLTWDKVMFQWGSCNEIRARRKAWECYNKSYRYPDRMIMTLKPAKSNFNRWKVVIEATGTKRCIVAWMFNYARKYQKGKHTPLFGSVSQNDISKIAKEMYQTAGLIGKVNTHSFRIGASTALIMVGCPADQVKVLGRWKSDTFLRYIRAAPQQQWDPNKSVAEQLESAPGGSLY